MFLARRASFFPGVDALSLPTVRSLEMEARFERNLREVLPRARNAQEVLKSKGFTDDKILPLLALAQHFRVPNLRFLLLLVPAIAVANLPSFPG